MCRSGWGWSQTMSRRVSRGLSLTDKGRAAIGVAETVEVPLLDIPWLAAELEGDKGAA